MKSALFLIILLALSGCGKPATGPAAGGPNPLIGTWESECLKSTGQSAIVQMTFGSNNLNYYIRVYSNEFCATDYSPYYRSTTYRIINQNTVGIINTDNNQEEQSPFSINGNILQLQVNNIGMANFYRK